MIFHMWLKCHHLTTYQHILNRRMKKSKKIQQDSKEIFEKVDHEIITIENNCNQSDIKSSKNKSMLDHSQLSKEFFYIKTNKTQEIISTWFINYSES